MIARHSFAPVAKSSRNDVMREADHSMHASRNVGSAFRTDFAEG
jgi:hypothetical protein